MKTNITIKGIHCNACKALIEDVCKEIKGVKSCSVNFQTGETVVEHDENFDRGSFKIKVEGVGQYEVQYQK